MRIRSLLVPALAASFLLAVPAAHADPNGPDWYKTPAPRGPRPTIPSSDGMKLHADVLRPANLPADAKTPVILSIGPYFNHSGQTGPAGPVEGTPLRPGRPAAGPSDRFHDFVEGAQADGARLHVRDGRPARLRRLHRLPGLGRPRRAGRRRRPRSSGRPAQPWSTGKVGMYGKSYDGVTGLIGVDQQPRASRRSSPRSRSTTSTATSTATASGSLNSLADAALYDAIAATPGHGADDPNYNVERLNDTARPGCLVLNWPTSRQRRPRLGLLDAAQPDPGAKGSTTPLFLTQGLTENNTVADGA